MQASLREGFGLRVQDLEFRVGGVGFGVQGLGFRFSGFESDCGSDSALFQVCVFGGCCVE